MYGQIYPDEEFSYNGVGNPEASPIPESTSGYGSPTADLLDQISTQPTQDPDTLELSTEAPLLDNETTPANDSSSTLYPTTEEAPTESTGM